MVNKFVEMRSTHNSLSPEAVDNLRRVLLSLTKAEYFNLAAHGLMDVAHDFHVHGDSQESLLCEHMIAGVARGLKVAAEDEKRMRRCPHCGRRHR